MTDDILFTPHMEVREEAGETILEGLACPFYDGTPGTEYQVADNLYERFAKSAFDKWLASNPTVEARFNHDMTKTYAVSPNTLKVWADNKGLHYRSVVPMEVSWARDMVALVKKGVIRGSSFKYGATNCKWTRESNKDICTITDAFVEEVSPVYRPAYKASQALLRSRDDWEKELQWAELEKRMEWIHKL